jgi:NodT family efflux transporter outer membrane factor (OMF) lipoprotein
MRITPPFLAASAVLGLAACAAIPDVGPAPQPRAIAATQVFAAPQADWPADRWWGAYGDPQLDTLIGEALAGSPSLAQAQARVRAAQAKRGAAKAGVLPRLDLNGQLDETKQSYNTGIPAAFVPQGYNDNGRLTLDLGYDLDLWGRNRAALAAATSEAQAAEIDAEQARLTLTTNVVAAYVDLSRLHDERDAAAAALKVRSETARLVADREANGAANRGETAQARASEAQARQSLAAADEDIAVGRDRLAALLGAGPDRGLAIARPSLGAGKAFGLPANLAADLVGRRPDLQAARLRAEAAGKRIDVARAGFYPNLNIAGFIGVQSLRIENLTEPGSDIGQAGLALSLPIFHGGELRAGYRGARADYDAAVAEYDATLIQALQQAADATASKRASAERLAAAGEAMRLSEDAYRIARTRYEGGLGAYLNVLTAEDQMILTRRAYAVLRARDLSLDVDLVRALGGGFRAAA